MPRYKVTMRDGRIMVVDAADESHARSLAAKKAGTSWPGVKAEQVRPGTAAGADKCMMRGVSQGGETRYCQFAAGHKGEHSYAHEGER